MLAVNLFFCLALFDPKPHTGGDNASYIILAESILRAGDGYSDNITPGTSQPHTQYPFGYSLLLTPVVLLFGRSVVAFKFFSIALALGCVALFSLLVKPMLRPVQWAVLTLALALNPVIIDYSHWILSEISFLFFSLLSFKLFMDSEDKRNGRTSARFWLALLSIAFTAHIRTIGLGFALAGFAYYLLRFSWRRLVVFTLVLTLFIAPWMIRNHLVREKGADSYVKLLLLKSVYTPDQGYMGASDLLARVANNVWIYSTSEVARVILGSENVWGKSKAVLPFSVAASLLVLVGLIGNLILRVRILELYTLVYLGVILIWPDVVSDVRYLMPIIPLILLYLADGVTFTVRLLRPKAAGGVMPAALVVLLVVSIGLVAQIARVPANLNMIGRYLDGDRYAGYPVNWHHLFQAADWVKQNTPESSVVTVRKPRLFYLHTGRKVTGYPFITDRDSVFALISRTDYVVIDAVSGTTYRYLIPAMQEHKANFKGEFVLQNPFTAVVKVLP